MNRYEMTDNKKEKYEVEDKLKAAYALNMCTVSVSQIVDFNDEYILEQEYEAILNNLNLEQMPKDEALLNILVKLLNVITFFRIDKLKKENIEKKYQRKMRNAIWSAVPNIGVIVAGDPLTVGLSLATQVGIGYMNYRKEKFKIDEEKEDANLELQITAMEQFNALRRELFTTAWRLADEYQFPDRFRLTERQITKYNKILQDPNEIRKYERLESIQYDFEAYLPFWYFMGHSAKLISEDPYNALDSFAREYYKQKAKEHFEKYYQLNKYNMLREDELTASFALEYADLLLLEDNPDQDKINKLIATAMHMAGSANDIIELCAIACLKVGQTVTAEKLFRNLVNEDYNTSTNAKILSRIYVSEYLNGNPLAKSNYTSLSMRVPSSYLYPMPERKYENLLAQENVLQDQYFKSQKLELHKEYRDAINHFIDKYIILFNKIIPAPEFHDDSYYINTKTAFNKRKEDIEKELNSVRREEYIRVLYESGFRFEYVKLLNEMILSLDELKVFKENDSKDDWISLIKNYLHDASKGLEEIQGKLKDDQSASSFTVKDYERIQKDYSLQKFTNEFFEKLTEYIDEWIESIESLDELDKAEIDILQFSNSQRLEAYDFSLENEINYIESDDYISLEDLGKSVLNEKVNKQLFEDMLKIVNNYSNDIITDDRKAKFKIRGNQEFDLYFKNAKLDSKVNQARTLAIIDDISFSDADLLIVRDGVVLVKRDKIKSSCYFNDIEYVSQAINLEWPYRYSNNNVNLDCLKKLLDELKNIINGVNDINQEIMTKNIQLPEKINNACEEIISHYSHLIIEGMNNIDIDIMEKELVMALSKIFDKCIAEDEAILLRNKYHKDNLVGKGVKTAFGVVSKLGVSSLDAGTSIVNGKQLRDFGWEVAKEFYKIWLKDGHTKEDIPQYILNLENDM